MRLVILSGLMMGASLAILARLNVNTHAIASPVAEFISRYLS